MNKRIFVISIVFVMGFIARLTLFMVYRVPFSTDSWPLIGLAKKLLIDPSHNIFDDNYFDGYNNHWPGVILFSSALSLVLNIDPIVLMPAIVPFINGFALIIYYMIIRRFIGFRESVYSTLLLAVLPPLIVFTSAATKEGFAHPLFLLLFYISLGLGYSLLNLKRTITLIILIASTLVLSHHLTSFMFVYIIFSLLWINFLVYSRYGIRLRISLIPLLIMIFAGLLHYHIVGLGTFRIVFNTIDLITLVLYTILIPGLIFLLLDIGSKIPLRDIAVLVFSIILIVVVIAYSTTNTIAPGIPRLSSDMVFYGLPYVFTPITLYYSIRKGVITNNGVTIFFIGWFLACISLITYSVFSDNPLGTSVVHRIINFITYPTAFTIGFMIARLSLQGVICRVFVLLLAFTIVASGFTVIIQLALDIDDISFYWLYREADYYSGIFVDSYILGNITVAGDAKIDYLFKYFGVGVSEREIIEFTVNGAVKDNVLYVFHKDNYSRGVVSGLMVFNMDVKSSIISNSMNRIYSSIMVDMYIG